MWRGRMRRGQGWDDAARRALTDAPQTVKNINHFYVKNMTAVLSNIRIV